MVTIGLLITWLLGFSVLICIRGHFSFMEKTGLSFLIGMAIQTFLMLFMDGLGISLVGKNVLIVSLVVIVSLNITMFLYRKNNKKIYDCPIFSFPTGINLVWVLLIGLIIYLEYLNWTKCIFLPTFDRDSLAGFDTIGWVISQEHTLKGLTIFQKDYMPGINGPGSYITYMPMIQLSYAYVYMLGEETSKLIPALIYLSFLISFYGICRRFCGHTGAALATLGVLVTPEMVAFSSLSGTNVIHASYVSLGVLYTVVWIKDRNPAFFILAVLLSASNVWVRNEGIVFVGGSVIVLLWYAWKDKKWKYVTIYTFFSVFPFVVWNVFMKINGLYAENVIIFKPFIDTGKIEIIRVYFKHLISSQEYYGLSFTLFFIAVLINLVTIVRKKDLISFLGIFFFSLLFYMILLYQIDYKWDSIQNVLAYSAKRFLFCFIPLVWFYIVSNYWSKLLLTKLEDKTGF